MELAYKRNLTSTGEELICYLLSAYPTAQNSVKQAIPISLYTMYKYKEKFVILQAIGII